MIEPCLRELIASRLFYPTLLSGISLHRARERGIAHDVFTVNPVGMGQAVSGVALARILLCGGRRGGVPCCSQAGAATPFAGKNGGSI